MEWLDKGAYTYEWEHPPIGRVLLAIGPYLKGLHSYSLSSEEDEGHAILRARGDYRRNLALARAGNLIALVIAAAVVYLWGCRWFSRSSSVLALILFLSLPPVLAHAGVATLDMFCVAGLLTALYNVLRWLDEPTTRRAIFMGAAVAFALMLKFSNAAFLGVCCPAALICWYLGMRPSDTAKEVMRPRLVQIAIASGVMLFLIWASYRFPLPGSAWVDSYFHAHHPNGIASLQHHISLPVPTPILPFVAGLKELLYHNKMGHESYLLGQYSRSGWWYFFPIVISVKTPLAFLILAIPAMIAIVIRFRRVPWQQLATALFPAAIIGFCMMARINLGVRHVLGVYPFMALIAGHAVYTLISTRRHQFVAVFAGVLLFAVVAESWVVHPDYLAYFNQLAGSHPEHILSESDLDWGQDLYRLNDRLNALGAKDLTLGYFGPTAVEAAGITNYKLLSPFQKSTGWIAVSARLLTLENARDGSYGWLKQYNPVERVGKSIWLYRIDN